MIRPVIKIPFPPRDSFNNITAIINWNPLERCILMLIFAGSLNLLWVFWKTYIIFTPSIHQWVQLEIVQTLVWANLGFSIILFSLIYPCYKLRDSIFAQKTLPYICITLFISTLIFDGFYVGLVSPAAICAMICVVTVGLVLFSRIIVYNILFPSLLLVSYIMYQCLIGNLPYAPLFTIDDLQQNYFNAFWLASMLYFMLPIAVCCFFLFDIILRQWRHREQKYQSLSQIDPLTHLLNRRSINEYLLKVENEPLEAKPFYIILMDLDFFKTINDTYGHIKGDEVLFKIAEVLKVQTRPEDLVGRFGGEEFIILTATNDQEDAYQIAERCRNAIMQIKIYSDQKPIALTASFGIAHWQPHAGSIQEALHQADIAMYQAKDSGRNLVKFAS